MLKLTFTFVTKLIVLILIIAGLVMKSLKEILKNVYFQITFGIALGIILMSIFINKNSFFGVFAFIGFYLITLNIIRLIDALNGKKTDLKNLIKGIILIPLILGTFIGIVANELKHLGNTINGSQVFKEFGMYGLCLTVLILVLIHVFISKKNRKFNFSVIFSSLIVFPLLFISCISFINRYSTEKESTSIETILIEKESKIDKNEEKNSRYWIYANVEIYKKRFEVEYELWKNIKTNDTLILHVKEGNLGYQIVDSIEKKHQ